MGDAIRYSHLTDYNKCPKYYEHRHILDTPSPAPASGAMAFGTACHLGVQTFFEGGDGEGVFEAMWEANRDLTYTYSNGETWETLARDGAVLMSKFKRLHLKHFKPQYVEAKLSRGYVMNQGGGVEFSGTVDFAGEYKGVKSVVDFKTSAWPYEPAKLVINEQLALYNYMLRPDFVAEQHTYVVLKKAKYGVDAGIQVLSRPFTEAQVLDRVDNMARITHEVGRRRDFTRNTGGCMYGKNLCDYATLCFPELKQGEHDAPSNVKIG